MKIAFDAKRAYCNFTGLGNHSRTTLDILTQYYPENEYLLYTPKIKQNDVTAHYRQHQHLQTIMPTGIVKGGLWRTFRLADEVKKAKADVFHGLSNELPIGIHRNGVPSVVTIHDVAFKTFTEMYHWQDRQIYDVKWRYAVNHASSIIAISECTKQDILRFYNVPEEKVQVVYQPVSPFYYEQAEMMLQNTSSAASLQRMRASDEAHSALCTQKEDGIAMQNPFMLYVGSINSRKNLLGAVKALELLPESVRIPLYIVGGGREYKREVEQYVHEHQLDKWCIFLTNVSNDQLHVLYRKALLFVYPSFYEGFGLPLVEARLSGCPVITSNVSSLPEAAGKHSLFASPDDPQALSYAMELLIINDDLHSTLAMQSMKEALETLHPKVLAEQLMQVYGKVLSK